MINDILNVAGKELREAFSSLLPRGRNKIGLVILLFVFGIFLPLQNGREGLLSPLSILIWAWMSFTMVSGVVADSFAGERERHTLETLLATRLSDRAILIGKLIASLSYGVLLALAMLLLSTITVNLAFWNGSLVLPSPLVFMGTLIFTALTAGFAASMGVLVSLRAASVRQAQQTMNLSIFVLFIPLMLLQFVPRNIQGQIFSTLEHLNPLQVGLWAALFLLMLDTVLVIIGIKLFQRSKLILD